jgi:hypothetical protein
MNDQDILKLAFKRLRLKFEDGHTIEKFKEELEYAHSVTKKHNERIQDLEDDIEVIKRKMQNKIQEKRDRIKEIEELNDSNYNYIAQREDILHEVNVIEYEMLNPNLDIN